MVGLHLQRAQQSDRQAPWLNRPLSASPKAQRLLLVQFRSPSRLPEPLLWLGLQPQALLALRQEPQQQVLQRVQLLVQRPVQVRAPQQARPLARRQGLRLREPRSEQLQARQRVLPLSQARLRGRVPVRRPELSPPEPVRQQVPEQVQGRALPLVLCRLEPQQQVPIQPQVLQRRALQPQELLPPVLPGREPPRVPEQV